MNQHDYVKECLEFYEEEGFIPGAKWEDAHYPAPKGKGDATIPMLHDHHQVQGLWQSKEYGQCCFYNGHAKRFLTKGPFVSGWFELWDIYDEYKGENGRKAVELGVGAHAPGVASEGGRKGGTKIVELGVGIHAPGVASEGGRKGGKKAAELGVGFHAPGVGSKGGKKGSKTTNSQKWVCLDTGHISTAAGLTQWQKARGIPTYLRIKIQPQKLK
jgi:hypothetical protein